VGAHRAAATAAADIHHAGRRVSPIHVSSIGPNPPTCGLEPATLARGIATNAFERLIITHDINSKGEAVELKYATQRNSFYRVAYCWFLAGSGLQTPHGRIQFTLHALDSSFSADTVHNPSPPSGTKSGSLSVDTATYTGNRNVGPKLADNEPHRVREVRSLASDSSWPET